MDDTDEGSVPRSALQRLGNLDKDLIWRLIISANKHTDLAETSNPPSAPRGPDSYHVCLPCYLHEGTTDRWKTIRCGFHDLMDGRVTSGDELMELILSYNGKYKHEWDFDGLLNYCNVMSRSKWSDICATLRKMADHALNIEKFVKMPIPFLKKGMNASFALSKKQIACLLAHAFFCTFPMRNADSSDAFPLPSINFSSLFKSSDTGSRNSKLNCIFHYFNRVLNRMPSGKVVFKRQSVTNSIKWSKSKTQFTELYVSADGTIESENGLLQVDFANKYIGGGVLGRGCVQEEIMFMVAPELIVSRLFTEVLEDDEVLIMTGSEIYSRHKGYADTFEWTGNYVDKTTSVNAVKLTQIVAMDALSFDREKDQYKVTEIQRELNKAYSGFFSECKGRDGVRLPAVSTGNWGCGAFGGDKHLKSLIQMMAAAEANRDLCYFTYGDKELVQHMSKAHELIRQNNLTVGDVYHIVMDYIKKLKMQRNYSSPKLYDYLLRPKGT